MKNIVNLSLIALFLFPAGLNAQDYFDSQNYQKGESHLVLMHPTVSNIRTVNNLLRKDILILDDFNFVGVFHSGERYDYERTKKFIDTARLAAPFYLHKIHEEIAVDDLYGENALSKHFSLVFNLSEGIIFFGGPDLPPATYGRKTKLHTRIYDPYRHYQEASFLFHLIGGKQNETFKPLLKERPDYFILGICLGMQTMNVAAGGTLYQDIPSEVYQMDYVERVIEMEANNLHRNYNNALHPEVNLFSGNFHQVKPGDEFPVAIKQEPLVYSNHHQAIEKLGKDFVVAATSMDGKIVEAIQHTKFPNVLGIQFHPEPPYLFDESMRYYLTPEDEKPVSGYELLKQANSLTFHYQFWEMAGTLLLDSVSH